MSDRALTVRDILSDEVLFEKHLNEQIEKFGEDVAKQRILTLLRHYEIKSADEIKKAIGELSEAYIDFASLLNKCAPIVFPDDKLKEVKYSIEKEKNHIYKLLDDNENGFAFYIEVEFKRRCGLKLEEAGFTEERIARNGAAEMISKSLEALPKREAIHKAKLTRLELIKTDLLTDSNTEYFQKVLENLEERKQLSEDDITLDPKGSNSQRGETQGYTSSEPQTFKDLFYEEYRQNIDSFVQILRDLKVRNNASRKNEDYSIIGDTLQFTGSLKKKCILGVWYQQMLKVDPPIVRTVDDREVLAQLMMGYFKDLSVAGKTLTNTESGVANKVRLTIYNRVKEISSKSSSGKHGK